MSFSLLKKFQGLETSHDARYYISKLASALSQDQIILLGLSGCGDKDIDTVAKALADISQAEQRLHKHTLLRQHRLHDRLLKLSTIV